MFRSLRTKMLLTVVGLTMAALVVITFVTRQNFQYEMEELHKRLLRTALGNVMHIVQSKYDELVAHELDSIARRRQVMQDMTRVVLSALGSDFDLYRTEALTESDAKAKSLNWLRTLTYGDNQYFFVFDMQIMGLSHPLEEMIGRKWDEYRDTKQRFALPSIRDVLVRRSAAYAVLDWPVLSQGNLVKQMGYFVLFPQWKWIVGTSVRIDDIEEDSQEKMSVIKEDLARILSETSSGKIQSITIVDGKGDLIFQREFLDNALPHDRDKAGTDAIIRQWMEAAENPDVPIVHPCAVSAKADHRHLTYVRHHRPLDWYIIGTITDDTISAPVKSLITRQVYIIAGILLVGILLAAFISNRIAGRILVLARHASALPEKDLTRDDPEPFPDLPTRGGDDEVGHLIKTFRFMEDRLRQNMKALAWESGINSAFAELAGALIQSMPLDDISALVLSHAQRLTGSEYGYVGYVDRSTGFLVVPTFSGEMWSMCRVQEKRVVFEHFAGLYGWVLTHRAPLLTNSPSDDPRSAGVPPGHVKIERFLSVPSLMEGDLVGQISLANPGRDYTSEDLELLGRLASLYALAIGRKHTEEALRKSHEQLEKLVDERTADLLKANDCLKEEIRERRAAEEALRDQETSYRTLAENLPGIVYRVLIRQGFHMQFMNDRVENLTGFKAEELMPGKVCYIDRLIMPDDRDRVVTSVRRAIDQKVPFAVEYRIVHKDGTIRYFLEQGSPIYDSDGGPLYIDGVIFDTTQQKSLEAQLRSTQKTEAIGTLAGGIAHDFNNILAAIIGYTELALMNIGTSKSPSDDLQQILRSALRARDLIRQILFFSRMREQPLATPVEITPIIHETLKLLRATLPTTIDIRLHMPHGHPVVLADPTQIHQLLINLCTNAAHSMEEHGGILEICLAEVAHEAHEEMLSPHMQPGAYLELTISDTGHGMASDTLERIFDPYFTTKDVNKGSGLGLAVVRGIVERHKGGITVSSEPGKGTTFHVYLPKAESEPPPSVEPPQDTPRGVERVLFVDDEPLLLDMGKKMLAQLGYQVTACSGSLDALELFRAQPDQFDLVVTDFTMPHMTGADLAQAFIGIRPSISIVICTGFSEKIDEEKAARMGVSALLMKPFKMQEMALTLRRVLDGQTAGPLVLHKRSSVC